MEGGGVGGGFRGLGDPVEDRLRVSVALLGGFDGPFRGRPVPPARVVSSPVARGVAGAIGGCRGRAVFVDALDLPQLFLVLLQILHVPLSTLGLSSGDVVCHSNWLPLLWRAETAAAATVTPLGFGLRFIKAILTQGGVVRFAHAVDEGSVLVCASAARVSATVGVELGVAGVGVGRLVCLSI